MKKSSKSLIEVSNLSFNELFDRNQKIIIPEYQRPYTWTREKANDLLEDLESFYTSNEGISYYMGSILLYRNQEENVLEVIDGQQRLTTLLIFLSIIEGELSDLYDLKLNGNTSFNAVRNVNDFFKQERKRVDQLARNFNLFSQVDFTVIICEKEDLAFTFFDTQNNRGVSLSADDYLKAYHLREVQSEELQDSLASDWEKAALLAQDTESKHLKLSYLFYQMLYKGREWKGQSDLRAESKEELLNSFQKKTQSSSPDGSFPLYPNSKNVRFSGAAMDSSPVVWMENTGSISKHIDYPFSLRQPLHKGHHFFLYTKKYYEIHRLIFGSSNDEGVSDVIKKVREFYKDIYTNQMSPYLKAFLQLCVVSYYDVFGDTELFKAIQYFDYFIGNLRLKKYYVRKEAVKNSLKESRNNLLDVISQAYLSNEVFDFIKNESSIKSTYQNLDLSKLNTIRVNYAERLKDYYGDDFDVTNRLAWIK